MHAEKIVARRLTTEAFAPYGKLIAPEPTREPDYRSDRGTEGWKVELQVGDPLYMTLRTPPSGRRVDMLECHLNVSQTFLPLGGGPAVLVVSKRTDPQADPTVRDTAAFVLDGSVGYALDVGTWHSLDRLPITGESTAWLMITDSRTQDDLVNLPLGTARHTRMVDLTAAWGHALDVDV